MDEIRLRNSITSEISSQIHGRDRLLLALAEAVCQMMAQVNGRADQDGWLEADFKSAQRELSGAIHAQKNGQ